MEEIRYSDMTKGDVLLNVSILNGSDDGVMMHFEEFCFRTLSIVRLYLKTTFRKLALLPSSGKKGCPVIETSSF
jgi:hypothetical protein